MAGKSKKDINKLDNDIRPRHLSGIPYYAKASSGKPYYAKVYLPELYA